jgi:hypothetical protein
VMAKISVARKRHPEMMVSFSISLPQLHLTPSPWQAAASCLPPHGPLARVPMPPPHNPQSPHFASFFLFNCYFCVSLFFF